MDHLVQIPGPDLATMVVLPMSDIYRTMAKHKRALLGRAKAGLDLTLNFSFSLSKIKNQAHRFPSSNKVINQLDLLLFALLNFPEGTLFNRVNTISAADNCLGYFFIFHIIPQRGCDTFFDELDLSARLMADLYQVNPVIVSNILAPVKYYENKSRKSSQSRQNLFLCSARDKTSMIDAVCSKLELETKDGFLFVPIRDIYLRNMPKAWYS